MAFAELRAQSSFSFLHGASHPEELVAEAFRLGLNAIAITDLNGVYGAVRAWDARKHTTAPFKLIYGALLELDPIFRCDKNSLLSSTRASDELVFLAKNKAGWAELSELITKGKRRAQKGGFALYKRDIDHLSGENLFVLCGGLNSRLRRVVFLGKEKEALNELQRLHEIFGDSLCVELNRLGKSADIKRSRVLDRLAQQVSIDVVATNAVLFHHSDRKRLQDVFQCIRNHSSLDEAGRLLLANAARTLKSAETMQKLFSDIPQALTKSLDIAEACNFCLEDLHYSYPIEAIPSGMNADLYLATLAKQGLAQRLGEKKAARLQSRLEEELKIIKALNYAGYFLTMHDIVRFCFKRKILCQGRGSAANSLVCYAIEVTNVSPYQIDMLFERFLSLERKEPPDIDLDIEHERREEVIQYVYQKYGRDKAAMVATVIRYRHRSALRDVGKVLGLSEDRLARLTKIYASAHAESTSSIEALKVEAAKSADLDPNGRLFNQLLVLSDELVGFPRHLSIHTGGFLLSEQNISAIVPIENGRMEKRTVIQWDKDDIELLGLFKVDLLGLGMLNVIARSLVMINRNHPLSLSLGNIPAEDEQTYQMIQKADTIGVFQIESRAQMNMLPRLLPKTFYDLVIEVALVRPGPIQGGMVHPFLRRRKKEEAATLPHPALKPILGRTLGVPIFQEQVMRIAVALGGYSPGEADQLRRDMAAWKKHGNMQHHQARLRVEMAKRGIAPEFIERIIAQIEGFGSYGFPESHAAAFAHLAYVSAYLKCHYPAEFAVALINAQPMGFYQVSTIVSDVNRHGVKIMGVNIQKSGWETEVLNYRGQKRIRLGLHLVRGLSEKDAQLILIKRKEEPYASIADLARKTELSRQAMDALAFSGALSCFSSNRREAIWQTSVLGGRELISNLDNNNSISFAELSREEKLSQNYYHAQSFIEDHPLKMHREYLKRKHVLRSVDLNDLDAGKWVKVAGLVIVRQRPGGGKMIFMALEDETGLIDVAVSLNIFARYRTIIMLSDILCVEGKLQRDGYAKTLLAKKISPLETMLDIRSRDFH